MLASIVGFVGSFLGGGLVVALLAWARSIHETVQARKKEHLQRQIDELYGPLAFIVERNDDLLKLAESVLGAYKSVYENKDWHPSALDAISSEAKATLGVADEYFRLMRANVDRAAALIESKYSLIDLEDAADFRAVSDWSIRRKVEISPEGEGMPYRIATTLKPIALHANAFTHLVTSRFREKVAELNNLRNWPRSLTIKPKVRVSTEMGFGGPGR